MHESPSSVRFINTSSTSRLSSPTNSSDSSSQSTERVLTPELSSSQESLPASILAAVTSLRTEQGSLSMGEVLTSSSPGLSKRPARDALLGATTHKRLTLLRKVPASTNNKQRRPYSDGYPPNSGRCQSQSTRSQQPLGFITKGEPLSTDRGYQDFAEPDSSGKIAENSSHPHGKKRWAAIASEPEFSPISQEQLAAEVKGIYAELVKVEAQCVEIDAQKAFQPNDELSTGKWQDLFALHRTLIYEHHDFFMATQHPSANPALIGLATKYSMPARMWKHGIHAFLEVLRHRRPHSQEYMLAFIYLAYQMMSLLLETVPGFTDTWIECLGDLARYRMAIEEDREIHNVWGGVAGRWYVKAADRHPEVGRLYHHSGILERPSLRKFYLYGRALTSISPFLDAKESLSTLCTPIVEDEHALRKGSKSANALVICFHARSFLSQKTELVGEAWSAALKMLEAQSEDSIGASGVPLAVTNIAAVLGFGLPNNIYRHLFDTASHQDALDSAASRGNAIAYLSTSNFTPLGIDELLHPAEIVLSFCYHSFNSIIQRRPNKKNVPSLLPYVHVMLVFIKSLHTLRSRLPSRDVFNTLNDILSPDRLDWSALASFLNHTAESFPISSRTESFASGEIFPTDGIPLLEDYMIRGLVWAQWYFASDWFKKIEDDDGSRCLEDDSKRQHRAARVQYLGMILAVESDHLRYDRVKRQFSTVVSLEVDERESTSDELESTSIGSDYVMVEGPSRERQSSRRAQESSSSHRSSSKKDERQRRRRQRRRLCHKQRPMSKLSVRTI